MTWTSWDGDTICYKLEIINVAYELKTQSQPSAFLQYLQRLKKKLMSVFWVTT